MARTLNTAKKESELMNQARIISAKELNRTIEAFQAMDIYQRCRFKIIEVGFGHMNRYESGHIPGAVYLDSPEFESLPLWNFKAHEDLIRVFEHLHLHTEDTVILYDRNDSAAGRLGILLLEYGFEDVRLLDGGYEYWTNNGYGTSNKFHFYPVNKHCQYQRRSLSLLKEYIDIKQCESLVSIRSKNEFDGITSGYCYIDAKGTIPGSVHGGDIDTFKAANGLYIDSDELMNRFQSMGFSRSTSVTLFCGTGWRASEVLFLALTYGYDNYKLYDGGWFEWSTYCRFSGRV